MECNVIKDLLPLYVDGCCSQETEELVKSHLTQCGSCKAMLEEMKTPTPVTTVPGKASLLRRVNDWKASVLQSVLLYLSLALIAVGVDLEAATPAGLMNGYWAFSLVVPATGFLLSLSNWYFLRLYKNRKRFSAVSTLSTLIITLCGHIWACLHYQINFAELFGGKSAAEAGEIAQGMLALFGLGIIVTAAFTVLSKLLSGQYAKMLGKD